MRTWARTLPGCCLLVLLAGCGAGEPAPEAGPAPVVVDLGSPEHQGRLLDGWSVPERAPGGRTWVWATALEATVELDLPSSDYRTLRLRCAPLANEPPQTVSVHVNGTPVRTLELRPGLRAYAVALDPGDLKAGRNVLTFGFGRLTAFRDLNPSSPDERRVAVAFDLLRLEPEPHELLAAGDAGVFFRGAATVKAELGGETRNALVARAGEPLVRALEARSDTRLEVAAGRFCPFGWRCRGQRTFRVAVDGEVAWERTLDDETAWAGGRVDLGRFTGESVTVELTVDDAGAGDEALALWAEPLLIAPREPPPPNVVLISIDTLRADHLGSYGHDRATSPRLDALAANGVRFAAAMSHSPWTTPSHMSLLTSLYPSAHRVNQGWSEAMAFLVGESRYRVLAPGVATLAGALREHGYRTYAVTGGATVAGEFGFARGFDVYGELLGNTYDRLPETLLGELRERVHREAPFFLFFHTFEVHAPYTRLDFAAELLTEEERRGLEELFRGRPADPIRALERHLDERGLLRREITAALYDGGIRAVDAFLGRFLDELDALGLRERTLVVVTSDHGEEFGDHDPARVYNAHCDTLYEELIRVPLLLRLPGRLPAGAVIEPAVELVDVAPTVLELAGVPIPDGMQGRSLVPLIDGDEWTARPALAEATCVDPELKALRVGDHKLIAAFPVPDGERTGLPGAPAWERLYDLRRDPREQEALDDESRLAEMRQALAERLAAVAVEGGDDATTAVSEEVLERLRALGYVE